MIETLHLNQFRSFADNYHFKFTFEKQENKHSKWNDALVWVLAVSRPKEGKAVTLV